MSEAFRRLSCRLGKATFDREAAATRSLDRSREEMACTETHLSPSSSQAAAASASRGWLSQRAPPRINFIFRVILNFNHGSHGGGRQQKGRKKQKEGPISFFLLSSGSAVSFFASRRVSACQSARPLGNGEGERAELRKGRRAYCRSAAVLQLALTSCRRCFPGCPRDFFRSLPNPGSESISCPRLPFTCRTDSASSCSSSSVRL